MWWLGIPLNDPTWLTIVAITEGFIYWLAGAMGVFGLACLCSKKLRGWVEGRVEEEEPRKPWLTYQWRCND